MNKNEKNSEKKILIVGASSGMGNLVAKHFIELGYKVGLVARRVEPLNALKSLAPKQVFVSELDICSPKATTTLKSLAKKMGGMDIYFHAAGAINENKPYNLDVENGTATVNVAAWTNLVSWAFDYFKKQGEGHLCAISSIAALRGLGATPAYSASKAYQTHYLQALAQAAHMNKLKIRITDIQPGFVATEPIKNLNKHAPLVMKPENVAKAIVRAVLWRRRKVIVNFLFVIVCFCWWIIPRPIYERLYFDMYGFHLFRPKK